MDQDFYEDEEEEFLEGFLPPPYGLSDFKDEVDELDSYLQSDAVSDIFLGRLEEWMDCFREGKLGEELVQNFFVGTALNRLLLTQLKKGELVGEAGNRASAFFCKVLDFVVDVFPQNKCLELLDTVSRIFQMNPYFYLDEDEDEDPPSPRDVDDPTLFAMKGARDLDLANIFVDHINHFGQRGGFAMLHNFVQDPETPLVGISKALLPFVKVRFNLIRRRQEEFFPSLERSVIANMLGWSNERIKSENRKCVVDVIRSLRLISFDKGPGHKSVDMLRLEFAFRCYQNDLSLETRLDGLKDLKGIINDLDAMEEYQSRVQQVSTSQNPQLMRQLLAEIPKPVVLWITQPVLAKWICEKQIVEDLFSVSSHVALLERCADILIFLARFEALNMGHLDCIWNRLRTNTHQASRHAIFGAISDLADWLNLGQFDYLYDRLEQMQPEQFDIKTINMFDTITLSALRKQREVKGNRWYCLDLFFELMQDETEASEDVALMCRFMLEKELREWNVAARYRMPVVHKCINLIREGRSVTQCLITLGSLINDFVRPRGNVPPTTEFMDSLEREFGFLQLLLDDLTRYKEKSSEEFKNFDGPDFGKHRTTRFFTHEINVNKRLELINLCVSHSSSKMTMQQVSQLWDAIIVGALTTVERDSGFNWFHTIKIDQAFSPEVLEWAFNEKLGSSDFASLSVSGFFMLEYYFRVINWRKELFRQDESGYDVLSLNLFGIERLWSCAFLAKNADVGKKAIAELVKLYLSLTKSLASHAVEKRAEFLENCMTALGEAEEVLVSNPDDEKACLQVHRALDLLQTFLREFEVSVAASTGIAISRHGVTFKGQPITVNLSIVSNTKSKISLETNTAATVGSLRRNIAQHLQVDPSLLRLIFGGKELLADSKRLCENRIENGCTISVVKRMQKQVKPSSIEKQQEAGEAESFPSNVLANHAEFFNELFKCLTLPHGLGEKVWELLMVLPTNDLMRAKIRGDEECESSLSPLTSGGSASWAQLFDASSTFRLLYSLQIVESIIVGEDSSEAEKLAQYEWKRRFLETGGLSHLLNVILQTDLVSQGKGGKGKECLALLLKIINFFTLTFQVHETQDFEPVTPARVDPPKKSNLDYSDFMMGDANDFQTAKEVEVVSVEEECKIRELDIPSLNLDFPGDIPEQEIVECLLGMLVVFASEGENSSDEHVAAEIKNLVCALLLSRPTLLEWFIMDRLQSFVLDTLLKSSFESIRKIVVDIFVVVLFEVDRIIPAPGVSSIHQRVIDTLASFLDVVYEYSRNCTQYFVLFSNSLRWYLDSGRVEIDHSKAVEKLLGMISNHSMVERRFSSEIDFVLVGLMDVLRCILDLYPSMKGPVAQDNSQALLKFLYGTCLFDIPSADNHGPDAPPMCKSRVSRQAAFRLLETLLFGETANLHLVSQNLVQQHKGGSSRDTWMFNPSNMEKSSTGYVGLKNQGCTCYMNSLFQQFFMIPKFRHSLLSISPPGVEDMSEEELADNLQYQIQLMFGSLQESEKKFYDAIGFCKAYKDWEGQPMALGVQMDVDEFFNMLFDRQEDLLRTTPFTDLLRIFFGGVNVNQMISKDPEVPYVGEREESWFTISVDVKNKKNLEESLASYCAGEMLEGDNKYYVEDFDKKVDALRRVCIKELPNHLIFHLKRFEFDLDQLKKVKVNDYFEFPHEINMLPYTKEGLALDEGDESVVVQPSNYYEYELVGVLVHTGSADMGHYYSFIKEREALDGTADRKWFEFNDKLVCGFKESDIPRCCFGGVEQVVQYDQTLRKHVTKTVPRIYNAYMLFYQRKNPLPEDPERFPDPVRELYFAKSPNVSKSDMVPQAIFNAVWKDNMQFLEDKNIFDQQYFSFLWNVLSSYTFDPVNELGVVAEGDTAALCVDIGTKFVVETLSHAENKSKFTDWTNLLVTMYQNHAPCSARLLRTLCEDDTWMMQMLLRCTNQNSRIGFCSLLKEVFNVVFSLEKKTLEFAILPGDSLSSDVPMDGDDLDGSDAEPLKSPLDPLYSFEGCGVYRSLALKFLDSSFDLLKSAHNYWRIFGEYFKLYEDVASIGIPERQYFMQRGYIARLVHFLLQDQSPFWDPDLMITPKKMGDKQSVPKVHHMLGFFEHLALGCKTDVFDRCGLPPTYNLPESVPPFELSESDRAALLGDKFLPRVVHDNLNVSAISKICQHFCWEDKARSQDVLDFICKGINDVDFELFRPYFVVMLDLFNIQDSLQEFRVGCGMEKLLTVIKHNTRFKNATLHSVTHVIHMCKENDLVNEFMSHATEHWVEMLLLANNSEPVREEASRLLKTLIPGARPPPPPLSPTTAEAIRLMDCVTFSGPLIGPTLPSDIQSVLPDVELDEAPVNSMSEEGREKLQLLLRVLCEMFTIAAKYVEPSPPPKNVVEDPAFSPHVWRLVSYFKLIQFCMVGESDRVIFAGYFRDFYNLFLTIDKLRMDCDENKKAAVDTWYKAAHGNQSLLLLGPQQDRAAVLLMDHYISLKPIDRYLHFNKVAVPKFYALMYEMCSLDRMFAANVAVHQNLSWATEHMLVDSSEYEEIAPHLLKLIEVSCKFNPEFREKFITVCLHPEKLFQGEKNCLKLLDPCLANANDMIRFCDLKGFDSIAQVIEQHMDKLYEDTCDVLSQALRVLVRISTWIQVRQQQTSDVDRRVAVDCNRSWESKLDLLPSLLNLFCKPVPQDTRHYNMTLCSNLCSLDPVCLGQILDNLFAEHMGLRENPNFRVVPPLSDTFTQELPDLEGSSPLRLREHRQLSDEAYSQVAIPYYKFVLDVVEKAYEPPFDQQQQDRALSLALLVLLETSGGQPPSVHSAALEMFCDSKLVNRFLECPLTIEYVKGLFLPRSSYLLHTAPVQNLSKSGFFSPVFARMPESEVRSFAGELVNLIGLLEVQCQVLLGNETDPENLEGLEGDILEPLVEALFSLVMFISLPELLNVVRTLNLQPLSSLAQILDGKDNPLIDRILELLQRHILPKLVPS